MGDGLCHGNWRVDSGGMDGVEDEPLRVQRGSTLVRDERGNAGGRRAVRAGDVKRGCGVGWVAGRPGHGCIAACGKPGGIGVCRAVCECGAGAAWGCGFCSVDSGLFGDGCERRVERVQAHRATVGLGRIGGGYGGCGGVDCRFKNAGRDDAAAWGIWGAGFGRSVGRAGDVCAADSVFCVQPGVLQVAGGGAANGCCFVLWSAESRAGRGVELGADAVDGCGGDRTRNVIVDREHVYISVVLEQTGAGRSERERRRREGCWFTASRWQ
jgi:hypothetical protein